MAWSATRTGGAESMREFRGRLIAGGLILGEVSGEFRDEPAGWLYVPAELEPEGLHEAGDLVLDLGGVSTVPIALVGVPLVGGRGVVVEFVVARGPAASEPRTNGLWTDPRS